MPSACTLYDVARMAGVSTATVSRVVHGHDRVRTSTRQRVLAVIEALGYVPDGAAQSMARRRKEVIGLVTIENREPDTEIEREEGLFIERVLRGVELALRPHGWSILISVLRTADRADAYRQMLKISAKVDGMVISEGIAEPHHLALLAARVPIVLVAGSPDEQAADVVAADNRPGMIALVRHMMERHETKRLFYVDGPAEAPDARERRHAFDETLAAYPDAALIGSFPGRFATISGELAAREILGGTHGALPGAIICANDQMAIGAMRELQAAGLRVPEDIAVTGFDCVHISGLLTPALTTVRQSMLHLGERGCALLLERIADPALPRRVERLPAELVVRESCGC